MENRIIAQRYRLLSTLGRGGMGSVWLAEHVELGTQLAIKLLDPSLASNPEWLQRFKREAQAAAGLDSPSIVRVFDYGIEEGVPYIAMELLKGESLAQRLQRCGSVELATLARIYLQICKALTKAHGQGIVHRDLKPANIFLTSDEDGDNAKLIDFGIAKRTDRVPGQDTGIETLTGAMLGTPFYMSPEQASGSKTVDFRTDIWSLGVIAFECITGKRLYNADSIGALVLEICTGKPRIPSQVALVPLGFDEWFSRCSAHDPAERFASARDAAVALSRLGSPTGAIVTPARSSATLAASSEKLVDTANALPVRLSLSDSGASVDHVGTTVRTLPSSTSKSKRSRTRVLGIVCCLGLLGAATGSWAWLGLAKTAEVEAERSATTRDDTKERAPLQSVSVEHGTSLSAATSVVAASGTSSTQPPRDGPSGSSVRLIPRSSEPMPIAVHGANPKPSIASKPTSAKPAASAKSSVTAPNKPTPPAMTPKVPKPNELEAPQDLFKRREG
ncbi:MAG: protein kinase domain-containing protein [Myxococcales bacterium]